MMKSNRRYWRTLWRINLVGVVGNAFGAALISFYFNSVYSSGVPGPETSPDTGYLILVAIVTVMLLVLGGFLGMRWLGPLLGWYRRATAGLDQEPPTPSIQRMALNLPMASAGITFGMWSLAGLFFGVYDLASSVPNGMDWTEVGRTLFGVTVIAGPTTTILIYFAVERIWRSELPLFFPSGDVTQTSAFRLSVRTRLLILYILGAMPLLLLTVLSYNHAVQMIYAPQPATLLPRLLRLELFLAGVGILLAVVLARTLGVSLVEQLENLGRRMVTVQEGNLDERLEVVSNDELGLLAEGFNAMVDGLQREEVIHHLFSRYVTPQVADYAIKHGAELGGQLVKATVLFVDIRGFTSLTEQMDPTALIALLNRYFEAVSTVIGENGGLVNKMAGDSVLAVFGTPLNPSSDHPREATEAAQSILKALKSFNEGQKRRGEPALRVGIGVATGPVLAGNMGSAERLEYTVIGDAVNLANRLQAMTRELDAQVLLSEATAAGVQEWASLAPMGQVEVRGKQEPVQVYALRVPDSIS